MALTDVERKKMFDMAMEMHELQRVATEFSTAFRPLQTRVAELAKEIAGQERRAGGREGVLRGVQQGAGGTGAEVRAAGRGPWRRRRRRSGRGRCNGAPPTPPVVSILTRIGQAKNGLMGGMPPTEQATKAYADVKAQGPKAFADANALFAKAAALSTTLAKYNLKLEAPKPVAVTGIAAPKK